MPGNTSHACAIFAWNAAPTHTDAAMSGSTRAVTMARVAASAANTRNMISSESETFPRFSRTVIGLTAKTPDATIPASGVAISRTAR